MKIHFVLFTVVAFAMFACGTKSKSPEFVDSVATETTEDTLVNVYADSSVTYATPMSDLQGTDTLFNFLARLKLVKGEFEWVEVVTSSFIDPADLNKGDMIAVVVVSGEGEYNGMRENIPFATQHALLAVLELNEKDQLVLVDHLDLGSSESGGLYAYSVESEALTLAEERDGVMIHNKSLEEGAGDAGFRKDDVTLYVLLKRKITSVLESVIDDFSFSSDEQGSWYESTTTVTINVMDEKTNGLFNLETQTSTVTNGSEPEEEVTEEPIQEGDEESESAEDGSSIFKWNGERYQ